MLKRLAPALGILLAPVFLRAQDLGTKADIVTSVPRTQSVTSGPVEPKPQKIITKAVVEMREEEPAAVKPDARVKAYGASSSGDARDDLKSRLEKLQRITKG